VKVIRRDDWPLWAVLILGLLILIPATGSLPLIDRDEPRFARASVEMAQRGDWVIPWLNGEHRFDKPPLTYWLMQPSYLLFGVGELAARMHSVLFSLLTAFLLYGFGMEIRGRRCATYSALFFLFSMQILQHGRAAVADMPMVFAVTWTQILMYRLLTETPTRKADVWKLGIALSLGFYAKGPIAWAAPMLSLLIFRFLLWRKPESWSQLKLPWVFTAALGLLAFWGIPALIMTDGAFWDVGMGKHVGERGIRSFNGRWVFPGYYLVTAPLSLFPGALFLGSVWTMLRKHWDREAAYLCAWFLAPFVIFSLYATQLPHYILPGFGGALLLIGRALDTELPSTSFQRAWRVGLNIIWALLCLVLIAALLIAPSMTLKLGILGLLLAALALALAQSRRWILSALILALGLQLAGSHLRQQLPAIQLQQSLAELPDYSRRGMWVYFEPSILFYSDHIWEKIPRQAEQPTRQLERWWQEEGAATLLVLEQEIKASKWLRWKLGMQAGDHPKLKHYAEALDQALGREYEVVEGFNPARGSWVRLRLYRKF